MRYLTSFQREYAHWNYMEWIRIFFVAFIDIWVPAKHTHKVSKGYFILYQTSNIGVYSAVNSIKKKKKKKKKKYKNEINFCNNVVPTSPQLTSAFLLRLSCVYFIRVATWENVPSDLCAQRKLKSACASVQSDQSFRCPHEELCIIGYPKCASEDSDQTARMRRLIWIFAWCTCPKVRFMRFGLIYRQIYLTFKWPEHRTCTVIGRSCM